MMPLLSAVSSSVLLTIAVLTASLSGCKGEGCYQFGEPQRGLATWDRPDGGCFSCANDGEVLKGEELLDACRTMCTADPECVSIVVFESPIAPFLQYNREDDLSSHNCCVRRTPGDADLFVDAATADRELNCAKQTSCLSTISKLDDDCPTTEPSPMCSLRIEGVVWTAEQRAAQKLVVLDLLEGGCNQPDTVGQTLLDIGSDTCFEETEFSSEACSFEDPDPGRLLFGVNQGGCFSCHDANDLTIPLEGDELLQACEQMCTADPLCVAYEVADPVIVPLNELRGDNTLGRNCCIEHDAVTPSHPLFMAFSTNGSTNNNCDKETTCWTSVPKKFPESSCKLTNPSPLCFVQFPGYIDEQDFQEQSDWVVNYINDGCPADNIGQTILDNAGEVCSAKLPDAAPPTMAPTKLGESGSTTAPAVVIESGSTMLGACYVAAFGALLSLVLL